MAHRTKSHAEADALDLEFWPRQTPEARLSALVAIREDIRRVKGRNMTAIHVIDLDRLIDIKSRIDDPRHERDVRDLKAVRAMKARGSARRAAASSHRSPRKSRRP